MEDLLIAILQAILETLFESLLLALSDFLWEWMLEWIIKRLDEFSQHHWFRCLLSLMAGAGMGALTLEVFPHSMIHHSWLRMANLLLGPLMIGWLSFRLAVLRKKTDETISPRRHFLFSFLFAIAFALIRFTYAVRN